MNKAIRVAVMLVLCMVFTNTNGQDTMVLKGKTYRVFDQKLRDFELPVYRNYGMTINHHLPPIIGRYEDGEYVMIYEYERDIFKRDKYIETVTVSKPYSVFTIKNNKKNGPAVFYNWDGTVYTQMVFKNDLLDSEVQLQSKQGLRPLYHFNSGSFQPNEEIKDVFSSIANQENNYYNYSGYSNDLVLSNLTWFKLQQKGDQFSQIITMNFKEGILQGELNLKFVYRSDTFLLIRANYENGLLNGGYELFYYSYNGKKVRFDWHLKGWNKNDYKDSFWYMYRSDGVLKAKYQFKKGACVYMQDELEAYSISLGKDSVLKYTNDTLNRISYPVEYSNSIQTYAAIHYKKDGVLKDAYLYNRKADMNFFKDVLLKTIRDTIFNGQRYRFQIISYNSKDVYHTLKQINEDYQPDLGFDPYTEGYGYDYTPFEIDIYDSVFDKKGKFLYCDKYFTNPFDEAFKLHQSGSEIKKKHLFSRFYKEEKFYFPMNNTEYFNYTFYSKRNSFKGVTHRLIGDTVSGALIRVFDFDIEGNALQIADTLWKANANIYLRDDYLNYLKEDYFEENKRNINVYWSYLRKIYQMELQKHCYVTLNQKPYNNNLHVSIGYTRSTRNSKGRFVIEKVDDEKITTQDIELEITFPKFKINWPSGKPIILPENDVNIVIRDGSVKWIDVLDIHYALKNYFSQNYMYTNNLLNGDNYTTYSYLNTNQKSYNTKRVNTDLIYQRKEVRLPYVNGMKQGQWRMGDLQALNFNKNQLDGLQMLGDENYVYYLVNYHNDSLQGPMVKRHPNGKTLIQGNFEHGLPDGLFQFYYNLGGNDNFIYKTMQLKNGFFDGQFMEFSEDGDLKYIAQLDKKDSMMVTHSGFKNIRLGLFNTSQYREVEEIQSVNWNWFKPTLKIEEELDTALRLELVESFKNADYTYFYKSGSVFKKGKKHYEDPVGTWTFYGEDTSYLYKEIAFKDSSIVLIGKDTLKTFGLVKTYYKNGQLMYKGWSLDHQFAYNCASGSEMPTENDHYIAFYDSLGNAVLLNDSGYIRELQVNGLLLKEGRIENNLKQGLWIYYSSHGLPIEMGVYVDGKKHGRWLRGDLGGINMRDDMCFMSDEDFRSWFNVYGKNLMIEEINYLNGKSISGTSVFVKAK